MAKKLQPLHWFPFDTDRWLGEIAGGLTAEQKGGLMDLLSVAWTQVPPCTLPDDNAYLAARSGLGPRWKRNREAVLATFALTDGGRLGCAWLLEIYGEQFTKYTNRSTANRTNRRGTKDSTNKDTNDTTNRGTNGATNDATNRGQEKETEGVVPPAPSGAGVEHPPAAPSALAPVGAALPAAKNGKPSGNPQALKNLAELAFADAERAREAQEAVVRAAKEKADYARAHASEVRGSEDEIKAIRKALFAKHAARVSASYDAWAKEHPADAAALEDHWRTVGGINPGDSTFLRRTVLYEWRKLPGQESIPDAEEYVAAEMEKRAAQRNGTSQHATA